MCWASCLPCSASCQSSARAQVLRADWLPLKAGQYKHRYEYKYAHITFFVPFSSFHNLQGKKFFDDNLET